jgi:stage III sporulation protein AH
MENVEPTITTQDAQVDATESSELVALRVENDETVLNQISDLQNTIIDNTKTTEEKNVAYEELKNINYNRGKEEELESIIKNDFNYESYIKIDNDQINIVINSTEHSKEIANNVIKRIQKEFTSKKYITVKFQ